MDMIIKGKALDRAILAYGCLAALAVVWQWLVFFDAIPAAVAQTVDVRPAVNTFLETAAGALFTVLSVVAAIGVKVAFGYVGLQNSHLEREFNARLDDIIHKGVQFALTAAQNEVAKRGAGLGAIKLDNWFIKVAADYIQPRAQDIMRQFKLDRTKLEEMILARAPSYFQIAPAAEAVAGGVATPPAAREANRELGKPSTAEAAQDPVPSRREELLGSAAVTPG